MLKTCRQGHQFFKNSDCPTCPICEEQKRPKEGFMAHIAAPARRALEHENIKSLAMLAQYSEASIRKLHGMGPSTIPKLKLALEQAGLCFKTDETLSIKK